MIPVTGIVHGKTPSRSRIVKASESEHKLGVLVLNLTRTCPLRCVYCYASSVDKSLLEIDPHVLMRNVLDRLSLVKPRIVILSGGEPFLYSKFWDVLDFLSKIKVSAVISTSGLVLDEEKVRKLVDHLISYVGISLDVPLQDVEEKVRVGSNVEKTLHTLRLLKKYNITTGVRVTLTWPSLSAIEKMFDLCLQEQIDRLCIYHLVPSGRGYGTYSMLSVDEPVVHAKFLTFIVKLAEKNPELDILLVTEPSDMLAVALLSSSSEDEYFRKIEHWKSRTRCSALSGIVSISPEGRVHPCQFMNNVSIGNVYEKPLDEVLHVARQGKIALPRCENCRYVEYCRGCAIRLSYSGKMRDPACALYALYLAVSKGKIRLEQWKIKILQNWASTLYREAL